MTTHGGGPAIVLFRDDLRLADHPALRAAVDSGHPVLGVYVLDDSGAVSRPLGGASRWWLHHSLDALAASLADRGGRLLLRRGDAEKEIGALVRDAGAAAVFWNRRYVAGEREQDDRIRDAAREAGAETGDFAASLLFEPGDVVNGDGETYGVFTPFWKAARRHAAPRKPVAEPRSIDGWTGDADGVELDDLELLDAAHDWSGGLQEAWAPGEAAARDRLRRFVRERLDDYTTDRNRPAVEGSSKLSPHLKFGEISPYQVWHAVTEADAPEEERDGFLSEIGWREFNWHLLATHPQLDAVNVHQQFDAFPWKKPRKADLDAWKRGRTGLPLVDAGMRQLWETGWMHNRIRMVTASFLIKNLLVDWRVGEQWFWDTLVDADPANNTANWQWVAGSGADAAPFFRVFNPVTQSKKFDPDGDYLRRWVPELGGLEGKAVHEPWTVDEDLVAAGEGERADAYPAPIVDLKETRAAALDAYERMRR